MMLAAAASVTSTPSMHALLRASTDDAHQRLHLHPGLAAVNSGTIAMADYRCLLGRLLGFYAPFEAQAGIAPERTRALQSDLTALGSDASTQAALPRCNSLPPLDSAEHLIGARYVIEGSALGGLQLARRLDRLLGRHAEDGRRFFIGQGAATASVWRAFRAQLEALATSPDARNAILTSARATFAAYERWMRDWKDQAST